MRWRRILLLGLITCLPVLTLAPLWLLPSTSTTVRAASAGESLEAWARQLRTGEQLPDADVVFMRGFEGTYDGRVYRLLADQDGCHGITIEPLGEQARTLPPVACRR